jgi:hypothetical protein
VTRLWRHLRGLWPGWTLAAPLPFLAHGAWAFARGDGHWENVAAAILVLALFSIGPRTKKLLVGVYPIGLVGLLYDSMRLVRGHGARAGTVHVCDLRGLEAALFGVTVDGRPGTVHDWLQAHWSPWLDRLCAVPYATFLLVCVACAVWLYAREPARMLRFGWCFFALNVAGFVTYQLYPAAPPWYYHAHGCAVDLSTRASEGPNLARVDAWLGVSYFAGMYGRSTNVFGAMPSLHCAYALLVALEGWPVFAAAWRAASVAFYALMVFAAVYLDHHWIVDALAGSAYAIGVVAAARGLARWRSSSRRLVGHVAPDASGMSGGSS